MMPPPIKIKDGSEFDSPTPKTPLVILAKPPDKNKVNQSSNVLASPNIQTELLRSPTVVQKASSVTPEIEDSAIIVQGAASTSKDSDSFSDLVKNVAHRVFHVQQKPVTTQSESNDQKQVTTPDMSYPVKLVDESLQWCDNALEYLHDGTDFYVIGVIGLQGVGKSTIMSIISGNYSEKSKWQLFKPQTNDLKEIGEHCTTGIDIYVTNQRVILLDTQSLQQVAFLMAVCHTIISVQDWFIDLNYLRIILSAEMLKPTTPLNIHDLSLPDEPAEYYPHLVFVQNHSQREDFYPDSVATMQETLHHVFKKSKLKYSGCVSCGTHSHVPKDHDRVNLFLMCDKEPPEFDGGKDQFPEYKGHPGYQYLAESLGQQVLSMPRSLLTNSPLSEKNWFHYSARIWETVKKSTLFLEYNRLLP
ncbi:nonsense-mediated mRNA decay factor SMG9 isoform X2 [Parasteatoda tepidariorum]|uniref:nonsense-mediated mRNA decay factor SMG9 isoform X2 n=1 Tax=Parasteatoda tepidariorum TaxID=114398 RepID=UPI0039BD5494